MFLISYLEAQSGSSVVEREEKFQAEAKKDADERTVDKDDIAEVNRIAEAKIVAKHRVKKPATLSASDNDSNADSSRDDFGASKRNKTRHSRFRRRELTKEIRWNWWSKYLPLTGWIRQHENGLINQNAKIINSSKQHIDRARHTGS